MSQTIESINALFVTREPELAERLISCVRMRGQTVRAYQAADRVELEERLLSHRFHIIVLIDRGMELGTHDVIGALQNSGRLTPVLVMTERPEDERVADYEAGAFVVISLGPDDVAAILILKAVEFHLCCTQMHRLQSTLQAAERRHLRLLQDSPEPNACFRQGKILNANDAWREYFKIDASADLSGFGLGDFVIPEQQETLQLLVEARAGQNDSGETRQTFSLRTAHGRSFEGDLVLTGASVDGEACTVLRVAANADNAASEQLSAIDPVTGLHNRQYLLQTLEQVLAASARAELPFALIEASVDDFERIHGTLGTSSSDILLTDIGLLLREHFPPPATVARLGHEDFAILVPSARRAELDQRLAALVHAAGAREINLEQGSTLASLSCGAIIADDSAPTIEGLLDQAARALDGIRQAGGNGYAFQHLLSDAHARAESDQQWKARIEDAIAHQRLRLVYQPVVNLHGGDFPRFSVFMRVTGPNGEVYDPSDFLPAAERTGMAATIDRWIISHAIQALADRLKSDPRTTFFLKLTRGSLLDGSVVVWLQKFLHKQRVPASRVVVEIKEATIITNLKSAISTASGLKAMNASLCIDDFGNGLNPFHILRHVDADYIKLDGAFVRDVVSNESSQKAIRRFTEGGHAKGKQIVVPMVEDAATLAVLFGLNVNLVQGYFVHPPSEQMDFDFTQVI